MAQRHEITAWVNPSAWDDEVEAQRVIEAIIESGSDDEGEWVRIAGGDDADRQAAADRDYDRADAALSEQVAAYRTAETVMTGAREALHAEMRRLYAAGMSAYRLAQVTGLAERHVGRIESA